MNVEILNRPGATMGSNLGGRKKTRRDESIGIDKTHIHGNNTENLPVELSLSQTSKSAIFLFIIFFIFLLQNWRILRWNKFCGQEGIWQL
jgi:hypothetical protein